MVKSRWDFLGGISTKARYPVDEFLYVEMLDMFFHECCGDGPMPCVAIIVRCYSQALVAAGRGKHLVQCGACPGWDASPVPGGSVA